MALTPAQLTILKNDILSDSTLNAFPMDSDGAFAIAALYAVQASPAFTVWKTNVPTSECKKAMVWTEFIARSVGERDAWTFMLSNGFINPADSNVRQGILDIFSGAQGLASRTALTALAKRLATRSEKLFSTGTGSDASPATMAVEGQLSYQDVLTARAS